MTSQEIAQQLEDIALTEDFVNSTAELTEAWSTAAVGIESVEPILRFMEQHPALEYGTPGPLIHFVERFYRKGYEERLVESVNRRPTPLTVWMLNRVLNGTEEPAKRQNLIRAMTQAASHPEADQATRARIQGLVDRLNE